MSLSQYSPSSLPRSSFCFLSNWIGLNASCVSPFPLWPSAFFLLYLLRRVSGHCLHPWDRHTAIRFPYQLVVFFLAKHLLVPRAFQFSKLPCFILSLQMLRRLLFPSFKSHTVIMKVESDCFSHGGWWRVLYIHLFLFFGSFSTVSFQPASGVNSWTQGETLPNRPMPS